MLPLDSLKAVNLSKIDTNPNSAIIFVWILIEVSNNLTLKSTLYLI